VKSYEQYCPVACALDVVGDRWTLLVLRELSLGPQRFTDLKRQLHGIPPKLLVERLDTLQAHGLVERQAVADGARHVYALTAEGERIREPLWALARFGVQFLPADAADGLRPRRALSALLLAYVQPVPEAAGVRWRIVLDGAPFDVVVDAKGVPRFAEGLGEQPDDVFEARIADLIALRRSGEPAREPADSALTRAFGLSRARDAGLAPA
jgi:DNA-binding HxlR family transcriptional regulator